MVVAAAVAAAVAMDAKSMFPEKKLDETPFM